MIQTIPGENPKDQPQNNNNNNNNNINQQNAAQQQQQGLQSIFNFAMKYSDPKVLADMKRQKEDPSGASVQNPQALPAPLTEHQVNVFYEALNEAMRLQTSFLFFSSFFDF